MGDIRPDLQPLLGMQNRWSTRMVVDPFLHTFGECGHRIDSCNGHREGLLEESQIWYWSLAPRCHLCSDTWIRIRAVHEAHHLLTNLRSLGLRESV